MQTKAVYGFVVAAAARVHQSSTNTRVAIIRSIIIGEGGIKFKTVAKSGPFVGSSLKLISLGIFHIEP